MTSITRRRRLGRGVGRRVLRRRARIVALLRENHWYTTAELAAILHISERTIRRDLREIEVPDDPCQDRPALRYRVTVRREYSAAPCLCEL